MMDSFCKILGATFTTDHRRGFVWIETLEKDDDSGDFYSIWLLVQQGTDRMVASIDGPTRKQICYTVAVEGNSGFRKYVSLDGAKQNALAAAMQILGNEGCEKRRKLQRIKSH